MANKFQAAIDAAKKTEDMTKPKELGQGGGEYTPPEAGPSVCRLIAYVETGKHKSTYQGAEKVQDEVLLTFELLGKRHPPVVLESGETYPHRITLKLNRSLFASSKFMQLFQRMNYAGKASHMAEFLGEPFACTVIHRTYKRRDGTDGVAVDLYDRDTKQFTVRPPRTPIVDEETGEETGKFRQMKVPEATSDIRLFLWDYPDMEQWGSLFIEGSYPERKDKDGKVIASERSKNVFQDAIKAAVNFKGSPIHILLSGDGEEPDLPAAEDGRAAVSDHEDEEEVSDDDPLAGVA